MNEFIYTKIKIVVYCLVFTGFGGFNLLSQDSTIVIGTVLDKSTREPLPYASVAFLNSSLGVTTDVDGAFSLRTKQSFDSIEIQFLGYERLVLPISPFKMNQLEVLLNNASVSLNTVNISGKRQRYKRKNNPAVDLIKKVIANKAANDFDTLDYLQYDQYEKVQLNVGGI